MFEVGAVDDIPAFLPAARQSRPCELREVERERRRREVERFPDAPGGHAFGARLHETTMDLQSARLRQRCERFYGLRSFHISRIMETMRGRQDPLARASFYLRLSFDALLALSSPP